MSLIITQEVNSVNIEVTAGCSVGNTNYDGGMPGSIYLTSQVIDGGTIA